MDDEPMWAADRVVAPTPDSAITIPKTANEFAIKGNHLTLVKENQFDGRNKTDPHKHIHEFLGICDMFIYRDTKNEAVSLMMFPLSLTGEAKTRMDELNEGTIETFADKQSGRPSGSLPSNTQPNLKGSSSKPYQPLQARNEQVNAVFTRSAALGASINLMPYSLYAKLSLETLKPTNMSVRLADRSFQYPVGIAENMLVEVGKFTFPVNFVILKMEEDSENRTYDFSYGLRDETSYSYDDICFSIDVIDEILEEDFDALLDKGSKILYSIEGTILEEKLFVEFTEFIAMTVEENSESKSDTKEPPFEKITFNTDYKINTFSEEPPTDLELKPLSDNLEYVFLEEHSFLPVIISSQLFEENKNKLIFVLKNHKQAFAWKNLSIFH
ncbi:reverse transcriptase domain-containing protein [Tanacetum coccineum]